jgi:hypothetical protein
VGGTVGPAIVGTIVANVQHDRLTDFLLGIGEPADQVSTLEGLLAQETETKQSAAASIRAPTSSSFSTAPATRSPMASRPPTTSAAG